MVGVGSIGERHVRCLLKNGRAVVSICETNERLRDEVGGRYAIMQRFASLDAALAEPHDAAVIAVPADLHIAMARTAVAAGLHVLIEKPLSVAMDGIDELSLDVERANVVAAVGYVYRAHPALAEMKQEIASGRMGAPVQIVVVAGQNFPTYRPRYLESYYVSRARGGGAIQDAMTHLVNAAEWLVGPVNQVVADAAHKVIAGVDVEDVVHFLARHGNVLGSYSLNQFQAPNEITITVVCERGTARFEFHKHRWRRLLTPDEPWQDTPALGVERDTLFVRQADSFLDAIVSRAAPLCSLREGIQTLRVNLALMKSQENANWQVVTLPASATK